MKTGRQKRLAAVGGASGAAYLAMNNLLPSAPDFLMGLLLGLGAVGMILGLMPEERLDFLRRRKQRGK